MGYGTMPDKIQFPQRLITHSSYNMSRNDVWILEILCFRICGRPVNEEMFHFLGKVDTERYFMRPRDTAPITTDNACMLVDQLMCRESLSWLSISATRCPFFQLAQRTCCGALPYDYCTVRAQRSWDANFFQVTRVLHEEAEAETCE